MLGLGNLELPIRIIIANVSVNIACCHEWEFWDMADHLKCIFCMFQHVVVVQYTKQCVYCIPHPT